MLGGKLFGPFRRSGGRSRQEPRKDGPAEKDQLIDARRHNLGADLPDLFAVVSWGCTATRWLGAVLNSHPQVFCVHALKEFHGAFAAGESPIDDLRYLKMLQILGAGYALAGDVHGVHRSSIPQLKDYFGDRFRAAAVIRDPIKRLLSQISLFERFQYHEGVWSEMDYLESLPGFPAVAHHYGDRKKRYFMHAAHLLNAVLEEEQHCRIFRTEDLTTRPDSLCELVHHLSADRLTPDARWAEEVISRPPVNRHNTSKFRPSLSESWQFEILRALVLPETLEAYRKHGYATPTDWKSYRKSA